MPRLRETASPEYRLKLSRAHKGVGLSTAHKQAIRDGVIRRRAENPEWWPPPLDERNAEIVRLRGQGLSREQIAKQFGISPQRVYAILQRAKR